MINNIIVKNEALIKNLHENIFLIPGTIHNPQAIKHNNIKLGK